MNSPAKATELFKEVIRDRWAPNFREMGFKGSGKIYLLPDEQDWAMLGIQSSTASNAEWVKFTLNLLVIGKEQWEAARARVSNLPAKPTPNVIAPHRYVQRIGHLMGAGDHWWRLYATEDPDPIVEDVIRVVRDVALPKLRAEMADKTPGPRGTFGTQARKA